MSHLEIPKALEAARVFPLVPHKKTPLQPWANDNTFALDSYPSITGYGVDTGRSGLVVIDCDVKNGQDGVRDFLALVEGHGQLPPTLTVETPSGGLHFYFKARPESTIRNSQSKLIPGVDVRAIGGYVVGPSSVILTEDNEEASYQVEDRTITVLAELPQWLATSLEDLSTKKSKKETPQHEDDEQDSGESVLGVAEQRRALYWARQKMGDAEVGERQEVLNKVAYFMGRKRVPRDEAQTLITVAMDQGLSNNEARKTFDHGYADGLAQPAQEFEAMVKEYNSIFGKDFKQDPVDPAYYTHVALSHNFAQSHPEEFLYWADRREWRKYNESTGLWDHVEETAMVALMDNFLDDLVAKVRAQNRFLPPAIYKSQERLWSKSLIEAVTITLRSRYIVTGDNLFDSNPDLLAVNNGVVDLRTGDLLPHDRGLFMSRSVTLDYDPQAQDTYCEKILESIAPEERDYLQLLAGQALTGHQPKYQAAIFLHGRGSNGKSTFLDLLLKTSGGYGRLQSPGVFLAEKNSGDKYAMADFEGLRTAIVEELPNAKLLDVGALKRLVGTSQINARPIYGSNRVFENQSTIFVSCNRLPMVNESDEGTWRRLLVVAFPYSYRKSKADLHGPLDRLGDPRVLHAAQARTSTAQAFLRWRIEGAIRWYASETSEYKVPASILDRVQDWNSNNDLLLSWFRECLVVDESTKNSYITFDDLFRSYNDYIQQKGNRPVSQRAFSPEFQGHYIYARSHLVYKKLSRTSGQGLTRSVYRTPSDPQGTPDKEKTNYFIGLRFA